MKWEERAELAFRIAGVVLVTYGLARASDVLRLVRAPSHPGPGSEAWALVALSVYVAAPVLGCLLIVWGGGPARWLITGRPRPPTRLQQDLSMGFVLLGCLFAGLAVPWTQFVFRRALPEIGFAAMLIYGLPGLVLLVWNRQMVSRIAAWWGDTLGPETSRFASALAIGVLAMGL